MPIDQATADAMIGTFRTMALDCKEKGYSGDDYDNMMNVLARMEQVANECDDVMAFSGQLMQEDLYMKFSNSYTRVLTSAYKSDYDPNAPYDEKADQALMKQSLNAYRDAIKRIQSDKQMAKDMKGDEARDVDILYKDKKITDAIQKVIDLGESGISYAEWCRLLIEKGLDKAMEGSVLDRENFLFDVKFAEASAISPFHIEAAKRKLQLFDEMCASSPIGMPDTFRFQLHCDKIDWELEPEMLKWQWIENKWERMFDKLEEWIMSYTSMAPYIFPWNQHSNPHASVKESQACVPGVFRAYEKMCMNYFSMDCHAMFSHPSFEWKVKNGFFMYSQIFSEFLLKEILPICYPNAQPSKELIAKAEKMHKEFLIFRPESNLPYERYSKVFDERFGSGEYAKRYGPPGERPRSNAAAWKL